MRERVCGGRFSSITSTIDAVASKWTIWKGSLKLERGGFFGACENLCRRNVDWTVGRKGFPPSLILLTIVSIERSKNLCSLDLYS